MRDDMPLLSQWIKKFDKSKLVEFFGSGTRIRTQTYRVRVCCATFTQFRYVSRTDDILSQIGAFVKRFSKIYYFCFRFGGCMQKNEGDLVRVILNEKYAMNASGAL